MILLSLLICPKLGAVGQPFSTILGAACSLRLTDCSLGPRWPRSWADLLGPDMNSGIGDLRQAKSRLGLSYAKRPGGKESLSGDESKATLEEVQVFCSPQIASLY